MRVFSHRYIPSRAPLQAQSWLIRHGLVRNVVALDVLPNPSGPGERVYVKLRNGVVVHGVVS